jgi:hypothetical protein
MQERASLRIWMRYMLSRALLSSLGTNNEKGVNLVLANPLFLKVPGRGIEPRTRGFSVLCSTD